MDPRPAWWNGSLDRRHGLCSEWCLHPVNMSGSIGSDCTSDRLRNHSQFSVRTTEICAINVRIPAMML